MGLATGVAAGGGADCAAGGPCAPNALCAATATPILTCMNSRLSMRVEYAKTFGGATISRRNFTVSYGNNLYGGRIGCYPSAAPVPSISQPHTATSKPTHARYGVIAFGATLAILSYVARVCISQASPLIAHDLSL